MDYVIKNNKNVYIKLNDTGTPVTCVEGAKGIFEYSKAKNLLDNLPKSLKKFNFKLEAIPDIKPASPFKVEEKTLEGKNYTVSDKVSRWLDKFGICDEVITEARNRKEELNTLLSNVDKELSNELHTIELEKPKNACSGYKEYKIIKEILERRRAIKDELLIVSSILRMDFRSFKGENIQKAISGLAARKFTLRVLEEGEDEVM